VGHEQWALFDVQILEEKNGRCRRELKQIDWTFSVKN
jgi:hypothetical protein